MKTLSKNDYNHDFQDIINIFFLTLIAK